MSYGFAHDTDFYSVLSEGSASDSDADNESQIETDEDEGTYFDTHDILSSEALRSASDRSREGLGNGVYTIEILSFLINQRNII